MKTRINHLTLILTFSVFTLFLFSCEKDNRLNPIPNKAIDPRDTDDFTKIPDYEDNYYSKPAPELLNASFSEVMVKTEFVGHPEWDVSIKAYKCFNRSKTLLVYNKDNQNLNFYGSNKFLILWFKDGKQIDRTNRLKCICRGRYAVVVINRLTKQGIGIAYFTGRSCAAEEIKKSIGNDQN